jgi:hypothetical protein
MTGKQWLAGHSAYTCYAGISLFDPDQFNWCFRPLADFRRANLSLTSVSPRRRSNPYIDRNFFFQLFTLCTTVKNETGKLP